MKGRFEWQRARKTSGKVSNTGKASDRLQWKRLHLLLVRGGRSLDQLRGSGVTVWAGVGYRGIVSIDRIDSHRPRIAKETCRPVGGRSPPRHVAGTGGTVLKNSRGNSPYPEPVPGSSVQYKGAIATSFQHHTRASVPSRLCFFDNVKFNERVFLWRMDIRPDKRQPGYEILRVVA